FHYASPLAIYTLSLHDALPICPFEGLSILISSSFTATFFAVMIIFALFISNSVLRIRPGKPHILSGPSLIFILGVYQAVTGIESDRKSTRLNSSHVKISYAVFC